MTLKISRASINPKRKSQLESFVTKWSPLLVAFVVANLSVGMLVPKISVLGVLPVREMSALGMTIGFWPLWWLFLKVSKLRGDNYVEWVRLTSEVFAGRTICSSRNVGYRHFLLDYRARRSSISET